jgi:hypothetical protein
VIVEYAYALAREFWAVIRIENDRRTATNLERTASKALDYTAAAERKAHFNRIGRLSSRALRHRVQAGEDRMTVVRELAITHSVNVETLYRAIIPMHNKMRDARYARMRDLWLLKQAHAGLSNVQIAELMGKTPQHVGRLLKSAFNNSVTNISDVRCSHLSEERV